MKKPKPEQDSDLMRWARIIERMGRRDEKPPLINETRKYCGRQGGNCQCTSIVECINARTTI